MRIKSLLEVASAQLVLDKFVSPYKKDYIKRYMLSRLVLFGGEQHSYPESFYINKPEDLLTVWNEWLAFKKKHEALGRKVEFSGPHEGDGEIEMRATWVVPATEEELAAAQQWLDEQPPEPSTIQWRKPIKPE